MAMCANGGLTESLSALTRMPSRFDPDVVSLSGELLTGLRSDHVTVGVRCLCEVCQCNESGNGRVLAPLCDSTTP